MLTKISTFAAPQRVSVKSLKFDVEKRVEEHDSSALQRLSGFSVLVGAVTFSFQIVLVMPLFRLKVYQLGTAS